MAQKFLSLRHLRKDQNGSTILEFAIIAPVFLFMLLGTFEIGYAIYMRSALNGAMQQAARDAALQDGNSPTARRAIDDQVRNVLKAVNGSLTDNDIKITRKSYVNFSEVERMEQYTDTNSNGKCDNNEPFTDENGNGKWGTVGFAGNGGARDSILYSVTVKYPPIFPFKNFSRNAPDSRASFTLEGFGDEWSLTSETLLKNQPFGNQATRGAGTPLNCDGTDDTDDEDDYEEDYDGATEG